MNNPLISIVIVSYNSSGLLEKCLRSIQRHTNNLCEIIVVDNDSSDGSIAMVQARFPEVICIPSGTNLGFGSANNIGVNAAKGEFVLLLNSDAELTSSTLFQAVEFMQNSDSIAAVVPRLCYPDGSAQVSYGAFPSVLSSCFHMLHVGPTLRRLPLLRRLLGKGNLLPSSVRTYLQNHSLTQNTEKIDWGTAACMLIRRKAYQAVGGFDQQFFMYLEDTDLCLRLTRQGWGIYFFPAWLVTHVAGGSVSTKPTVDLTRLKSRLYFFSKHYKRRQLLSLQIFTLIILSLQGMLHLFRGAPSKASICADGLKVVLGFRKDYR